MNILHFFAQAYSDIEPYSTSAGDSSAIGAGLALFALFFYGIFFLLGIAIYVVTSICLMKIFKKAGVPAWIAWVPIYNNWKLLEIGGQQGFWAVLAIIPIVNIVSAVFILIAQYHVGKKLGKGGEFVLWAIFIPLVWFIWLAFDKSQWNDAASTARSLHRA